MRIISGSAKGRKLVGPPGHGTAIRPTSDRAREALFSIIGRQVVGVRVLDLFAGTGALGCEALSRGADRVVFVENDRTALELIRKNIQLVPDGPRRAIIVRQDLSRGLVFAKQQPPDGAPFDLVFADPPYQKGLSAGILEHLDRSALLSERALVVIEEKKSVDLPESLTQLTQQSVRRYGDTIFAFYRRTTLTPTSATPETTS